MNTNFLNKLPEFSNKNFKIATYVSAAIIGCASLWFIYMMFATPDFGISTQWNMFKSPIFGLLYFVGLVLAIVNWGKFAHWSGTPVTKTYDQYGNHIKTERDYDITNNLFGSIILPMLGHFLIEPCFYAAIIYYPIMCVVALIASILPYLLTLLLVGLTVCIALYGNKLVSVKSHSLIIILLTIVIGGGLSYFAYTMGNAEPVAEEVAEDESPLEIIRKKNKATKNEEADAVKETVVEENITENVVDEASYADDEYIYEEDDDSDLDNVPSEEFFE